MSKLSPFAETLLDYARSEAKRNQSSVVEVPHLLVAIYRRDSEWFDQQFPGTAEAIIRHLEETQGTALKPESVAIEVHEGLEGVETEQDLKILVARLIEDLDESEFSKSDSPRKTATTHRDSSSTTPSEQDSPSNDAPKSDKGPNLGLNQQLAHQVSTHLGNPIESVIHSLASDARSIAFRVLKTDSPLISRAIEDALGEAGTLTSSAPLSDLLLQLVRHDEEPKATLATRLALAYVDVAEFAASLDDEVTEEEIAVIDEIRLETRAVLGDRIDATSDAVFEFEERFRHLIGMESVKAELRKRADYLLVAKRRARRGNSSETHRMHMAFIGNPGTGKTTAARLFGQLLSKLELLPSSTFIETDRSGLIGQFVGHTEEKTKKAINDAEGGVLFIDEAYALNDRYGIGKGFGEEALDVLVKEMEDRRDRILVVLAGYKKPMEELLRVNQGLRSRIPSVIEFEDYSIETLIEIAESVAGGRGLRLTDSSRDRLRELLAATKDGEEFGNARDVENMIDAAERSLTDRLSLLGNLATDSESHTLEPGDFPLIPVKRSKQIGFAARSSADNDS